MGISAVDMIGYESGLSLKVIVVTEEPAQTEEFGVADGELGIGSKGEVWIGV